MNFIRRIGRDEIYIKYVHQLVNVSLTSHMDEGMNNRVHIHLDASPIAELRGSRSHTQAAFRPAFMGPQHLRWTDGGPWLAPAVAFP